ncbi:leucine-rich repeat receptor-like protein kinase [Pyrus ussuriensis x Pyrus communis]|uniref:non-specific serine/threonine protein kinase n=1 Tax=Pyrus ussuriensis x Pyrus communis TaxID=2448454 RepID=A0A5N5I9E3_9ROSA|nr:leucine-rich repeat receptor-like protein kinase [Pyrus ussuriensis x Pyrus communis]
MWRDARGKAPCDSSSGNSEINNDNSKRKNINSVIIVIISFLGFDVVETIIGFFIFLVLCKRSNLQLQDIKTSQNFENFESMILQVEVKFTFGEVVKVIDDFHEKYCIGIGGFGRVYKVELESGHVVAVKKLNTVDSHDIPAINSEVLRIKFEL